MVHRVMLTELIWRRRSEQKLARYVIAEIIAFYIISGFIRGAIFVIDSLFIILRYYYIINITVFDLGVILVIDSQFNLKVSVLVYGV